MKFSLEFDMNNAAFDKEERAGELSRILTLAANRASHGCTGASVVDVNGNTVGWWEIEGVDEED